MNQAKENSNRLFETLGENLNPKNISRTLLEIAEEMKKPLFTEADRERFKNNRSRFENETDQELKERAIHGI
jgi:hypothetical protein